MVKTVRNARAIEVSNIQLSNGKRVSIYIPEGHAAIDSNGYVRFFHQEFSDGAVGYFKLMPKNSDNSCSI